MAEGKKSKRLISLDVIRTIAIFFVVTIHAYEVSFNYGNFNQFGISTIGQICALGIHVLGRVGVPLFFFLTGYLMLDRDYENTDITEFWKNHLLPLVLTSTIWGLIYFFFGVFVEKKVFNIYNLILEITLFNQYEAVHFWYIPVILGLYIFLPIISIVLKKLDPKVLLTILCISIFYYFTPATVNPILQAAGTSHSLLNLVDLSWSGGVYGIYIILGYLLKKYQKRCKSSFCFVSAVLSYLFLIWEEYFCYTHGKPYDLWYDNGMLIIFTSSLFILMLRIKRISFRKGFTWISRNAFGIYLIHYLFIRLTVLSQLDIRSWKGLVFLTVISLAGSIIACMVIGQNKKAAKILLYKK